MRVLACVRIVCSLFGACLSAFVCNVIGVLHACAFQRVCESYIRSSARARGRLRVMNARRLDFAIACPLIGFPEKALDFNFNLKTFKMVNFGI